MEKTKFELSEFNINVDFKDREHIDLLKKQIESGYDLPLEVYEEDGVYKVIDGGHTLIAYQKLGKEPKNVKVLTFKDDAEKIAYSRHKNINRLQRTPVTLAKSIVEELKLRFGFRNDKELRSALHRAYDVKHGKIKNVINNDENLVKRFTRFFELETIKFDSFAKENVYYLDFPLWLAEMVDAGQLSAQQASILNKKEVLQKFNEETVKRLASLLEGKSVKDSERAIDQLLHFEPEVYNVWNFPNCNPLFGTDGYPGRIPGQIVQNVLYYYTNENDLVVDPMAGGGTIIDVCKLMNRRYLAYDIKPIEKDGITEHDIRNGFPDKTKGCDLIFLDPPYHNMVFDFFETVDDFYSFISKLAQNCYNTVKENGVVSLLMGNTNWKGDGFQDLSFQCYKLFIDAGFIPIMRIAVPFITEQFERFDVERAKKEKEMLGLVRDLIIFKKV